ncbi:MAG: flagellar M-ring protein FliF [Gammaproteobacteria bacterium]|nr:flagellar M-ring protein FliF [Gammaproteobacteria bacterium]
MAETDTQAMVAQTLPIGANLTMGSVLKTPLIRQLALLVGLALAIAVGINVAMWAKNPNFVTLFANLTGQDTNQIIDVLRAAEMPFKIDSSTGTIMVGQDQVHEARLKLAAQGLPGTSAVGLEMLQKDQGIGTSQFIETARYHHALESELARSIASIHAIETARVHLALPKQSVFVRKRVKTSASVFVRLYPGRNLERGQIDAIVHMVASSIANLEAGQVTLVDQNGRLLTSSGGSADIMMSNKQFEYKRQIEKSFVMRITDLLEPIVGMGKVRAQITARLDFESVESTSEVYDPAKSVVRSEQVAEEQTRTGIAAEGIPGALSNQAPGAGTTAVGGATAEGAQENTPTNQTRSSTRNFEVDRVISHTRRPTGTLQRLSVAVVIDDKTSKNDKGVMTRSAYSEAEVAEMTTLIKEAIGFEEARGDSISVMNRAFVVPDAVANLPEVPIWEQGWFWNLAKQVLGALGVLLVYLIVLKPIFRNLFAAEASREVVMVGADGQPVDPAQAQLQADTVAIGSGNEELAGLLEAKQAGYEGKLEFTRGLVQEDPKRVANVVKNWVEA